jgi:hypothetical protein
MVQASGRYKACDSGATEKLPGASAHCPRLEFRVYAVRTKNHRSGRLKAELQTIARIRLGAVPAMRQKLPTGRFFPRFPAGFNPGWTRA